MQTLLLKRQWSKQPLIMTGKRFCNYQKCPTVLSEEFKKSYSRFSQVKSYLTKPTQSLLKQAVLCKSCQGFQKLHLFQPPPELLLESIERVSLQHPHIHHKLDWTFMCLLPLTNLQLQQMCNNEVLVILTTATFSLLTKFT